MGNYQPKKSRLNQNRIEKIITELIDDCKEDRKQIYETIKRFEEKLKETSIVDYAQCIVKCLESVHNVNDKILKLIEISAKIAIKEIEVQSKGKPVNANEKFTFEDLQNTN
jgi:hypothetical protein